jgi:pimeloyl-ACP methyl ester carboxylesterase
MDSIKNISCPITLLQGEIGSTTRSIGVKLLKERDPLGAFKVIKKSSHFLPMEFPEIIQEEIIKIKSRIKPSS